MNGHLNERSRKKAKHDVGDKGGMQLRVQVVSIRSDAERNANNEVERTEQSDETGKDLGPNTCDCGTNPDTAEYCGSHPQPVIKQRMISDRARAHTVKLGGRSAPRSESEVKRDAPADGADEQTKSQGVEPSASCGNHRSI